MVLRVLVALALLCSVAGAEDKPWAKGVSAKDQELALTLYNTANDLFEKGSYTAALTNYEAALEAWDHPGIHFNTAICLKALERWVDVYEHLEKALAHGEAPLGKDLYKQGQELFADLKTKIGTLEVTLKTPGAVVKLDGETLLDAPGTVKRRVLTEQPHQLVAEKTNYETESRALVLQPNATTTLVLEMKLKERGRTQRRWARWKPWVVVGSSSVVALTAAFVLGTARDNFDDYDRDFAIACPNGCAADSVPTQVNDHKQAGERRQTIAYGIFAASGATLVAGLVLVVLNQPRLVGTTVTPTVGSDHAGAMLSTSW